MQCRGQLPLVGNGDILAVYEFAHRMQGGECHAAMVGRGALIKPWVRDRMHAPLIAPVCMYICALYALPVQIFQEVASGQELLLTAEERIAMYHTLAVYMKDHFGSDERGKKKAWYFYPFHFEWFARYRPFPAVHLEAQSEAQPLICTRWDVAVSEAGEDAETLSPLERLLRCAATPCHERLAEECWAAESAEEAVERLTALAQQRALVEDWEALAKGGRENTLVVSHG